MAAKKALSLATWPALLLAHTSQAFVANPQHTALSSSPRSNSFVNGGESPLNRIDSLRLDASIDEGSGVQLISLESLGDDHEAVGDAMGKSVAAWLDEEWMPQEVHVKMGTSVSITYVSCRSKGLDEVAEIMTDVTDVLYANWEEYNADAFVNAWDIGNYVADYLIAKSGSETCGCSTQIVE